MPKCKNCNNLYNLSNEDDAIVGKWCPKINDSPHLDADRDCEHYKAMTNADRIRSMTDEELALAIVCPAEYDLNFNKNEWVEGKIVGTYTFEQFKKSGGYIRMLKPECKGKGFIDGDTDFVPTEKTFAEIFPDIQPQKLYYIDNEAYWIGEL